MGGPGGAAAWRRLCAGRGAAAAGANGTARDNRGSTDPPPQANLVNYFGRSDKVDSVEVHPVLLKKGDTRVALYGLGSMRDERLNRMWQQKKVKFLRPTAADRGETYFSIFVLHQNRDTGRGRNTCVHESMIPEWFDLVIWGHEHECQIKPRESAVGTFRVSQPGSGVATSLVESESKPKQCGLLQIRGEEFRLTPLKLTCQRPFVVADVVLADEETLEGPDAYDDDRDSAAAVADVLADKVETLINEISGKARPPRTKDMLCPMARPDQVLVRLRVDHTGFATINNAKFGGRFVGRVANAATILHFSRQKAAPDKAKKAWQAAAAPVEEGELDSVRIEDLARRLSGIERLKRPFAIVLVEMLASFFLKDVEPTGSVARRSRASWTATRPS